MGWTYSSTSAWRVGGLCVVGVLALWGTTQSEFEEGERGRGIHTEKKSYQEDGFNTSTTTSLTTFYQHRILPLMLYPDEEEEYTVPGDVILDDFRTIVTQMMHLRRYDDEDVECTAMDLRSLTDKYQLLYFHDTVVHQSYCILMTVSRHFPWGTVIVRPPSTSRTPTNTTTPTTTTTTATYHSLSIDCPHPLHDRGTGEMSIAIFQGTRAARSLVLAGAHRHAARHHDSTHPEPSSISSSCQGPTYAISDAAHSNQTGFHVAVSAIHQYYSSTSTYNSNHNHNNHALADDQTKVDESDNPPYHTFHTAIQFHGMGETSCPGVDAYVTHGMAHHTTITTTTTTTRSSPVVVPQDEDVLVQIQRLLVEKTTSLRNHTGGKTVILLPQDKDERNKRRRTATTKSPSSHDDDDEEKETQEYSCSMSGGSNVQGRLLNGVPPDQVCTHAASSVTRRFVHIEQKPWLRQERIYPIWMDILNQIFHSPPPTPT